MDLLSNAVGKFGGSFSADALRVNFAGLNAPVVPLEPNMGMLVQRFQASYQRPVTQIYELGSPNVYFVEGRPRGQAALGTLVGPRPIAVAFYRKFGNVCNIATNTMNFHASTGCFNQAGAGNRQKLSDFALKYCIIISVDFSVQVQDSLINEQVQLLFGSLEIGGAGR